MSKPLFFCFGPPKSGTTLLQRALNLHPEVYCPAEHQFSFLADRLKESLEQYEKIMAIMDNRTGGQGTAPLDPAVHAELFRVAVRNILVSGSGSARIAGAKDNKIIGAMETYRKLFPDARFVVIFRNPLDVAVSAWHHNLTLAQEENNPAHKELMTRHGNLDEWVRNTARAFSTHVRAYQEFQSRNDNILMLRYEDLVNRKAEKLTEIFAFLGVSTNPEVVAGIADQSSLEKMKAQSRRKTFFRSGGIQMGGDEVSNALREEVSDIAADALNALGYVFPGT